MRQVEVVKLRPGSSDRLITTVFLAGLLHGMIILGVSFSGGESEDLRSNTLEVTLVATPDEQAPDEPDYLAQAHQRGAGNIEERVRPESAQSTLDQMPNPGLAEGWAEDTEVDVSDGSESPDTLDSRDPEPEPQPLLTANRSPETVASASATPRNTRQPLQLARLLTDGEEQADPISDDDRQPLAYSDNPRERFISVNTREHNYAQYLESWRRRVESVGNDNYPEEARQQQLRGALTLEVAIAADGTLREVRPLQSSGHAPLDRAAARIVRMASPFPPFPEAIREETDIIRFAFRWEFGADRTVRTGVRLPAD
ncbi:energy transducer TonB [Natronospira bacteriovora]|uniref:TonB family protein n=1 Tax=Natronospira bacteriovora TaxID=3069753 RepID=A0ABU0W9M1_9GAMM|nr:TonB family protein [Natronospira sp. AB-CW4]MDQ2070604.1 TonB family protein [Natronospira sp. AB-CW4]